MSQQSNLEVQYVDEYKQIIKTISSKNLFDTKKIYVIVDDIDIMKHEEIWPNIKANGNILVFKYNNLDKRSKFYKYFENKIVEFEKVSEDILVKYIQKDIPSLKIPNCEKLIEMCGKNYNQILLELDKINNYIVPIEDQPGYDYGINYRFNMLEKQGAFHKEISDITFEFVEKVLKRDVKEVYRLQKELKQIGESNLKLLSLLYTNMKTILLIQSCKSNDICKTTGLQYYQVKYNQDKLGYYRISELVNALRVIQRLESGIKSGKYDEQIVIDYFVVNVI